MVISCLCCCYIMIVLLWLYHACFVHNVVVISCLFYSGYIMLALLLYHVCVVVIIMLALLWLYHACVVLISCLFCCSYIILVLLFLYHVCFVVVISCLCGGYIMLFYCGYIMSSQGICVIYLSVVKWSGMILVCQLIFPWTKWPPLRRRHFQMHFREWKVVYFD